MFSFCIKRKMGKKRAVKQNITNMPFSKKGYIKEDKS